VAESQQRVAKKIVAMLRQTTIAASAVPLSATD
jgi:hypothetical protein